MGESYLNQAYEDIINLLKSIHDKVDVSDWIPEWSPEWRGNTEKAVFAFKVLPHVDGEIVDESYEGPHKRSTRSFMTVFSDDRVSVTRIRNNYITAHASKADLCLLSDFEDFKHYLTIVNGCYVTMGNRLILDNSNVVIRDTALLAPAGKSLESIGELYGENFKKISVSKDYKENMKKLLLDNKSLFDSYALRDSVITLVHSCYMEDYVFNVGFLGVPLTLPSLATKYVKHSWEERGYGGYQLSPKYLLANVGTTVTPKGLAATEEVGLKIAYYIANYKGGRNECFMYGRDTKTNWWDYDLKAAYTTIMGGLGNPDYSKAKSINSKYLYKMSDKNILYSYIIMKVKFKFDGIKYPSIPVAVDETTTVYPLEGEGVLTGAEYILARNQGCKFTFEEIFLIPFEKGKKGSHVNKPFEPEIKEYLKKRAEYTKNREMLKALMQKVMAVETYGSVSRGISEKLKYDIQAGRNLRMEASDLSNPMLASWITGFCRSVMGECIHNVSLMKGGKVVSTTTDGFLTNIRDLEKTLIKGHSKTSYLLKAYRDLRKSLTGDSEGLEVKHEGLGVISWTTRGQLSKNANLLAATGFQKRYWSIEDVELLFKSVLGSDDKSIEYVQSSLRSALDVFKEGGHVTKKFKDTIFRLQYDNRRIIIEEPDKASGCESGVESMVDVLLDTEPVPDKAYCKNLRVLSRLHRQVLFNKETSVPQGRKYKNYTELAVRNFIKGVLSDPPKFNLQKMGYSEIIAVVRGYDGKLRVTKQSISNLKNRKLSFKAVPVTKETLKFVEYLKSQERFKDFDDKSFLQAS